MSFEQKPVLEIVKLTKLQENLFSNKAKVAMTKKSTGLVAIDSSGEIVRNITFAKQLLLEDIELGAKEIADQINKLADQDLIHSASAQLSKIELAPEISGKYFIVFCMVLVPYYKADELEAEGKAIREEAYYIR
jgi:hypothetical protein